MPEHSSSPGSRCTNPPSSGEYCSNSLSLWGGLKDGCPFVLLFAPLLWAEEAEGLDVPACGVAAPGFGLHVVPEHEFLPLPGGPGGLAGERTGLTSDALVDVKDPCKLAPWAVLRVPVGHLSVNLPI